MCQVLFCVEDTVMSKAAHIPALGELTVSWGRQTRNEIHIHVGSRVNLMQENAAEQGLGNDGSCTCRADGLGGVWQ